MRQLAMMMEKMETTLTRVGALEDELIKIRAPITKKQKTVGIPQLTQKLLHPKETSGQAGEEAMETDSIIPPSSSSEHARRLRYIMLPVCRHD